MENNNNNTTNYKSHNSTARLPDLLTEAWIWTTVQLIIALVGIVINAAVIFAAVSFNSLRKGIHGLILSLAIASLLCDVFLKPSGAIALVLQWYGCRPARRCAVYTPLLQWFISTVSYHIAAISINRFMAVVFPHTYHAVKRPKVTAALLLFCWLVPLIVAVICASGVLGMYSAAPPFGYCLPESAARNLTFLVQTTMVYGPTLVMALCYAGIFVKFLMIRGKVVPMDSLGRLAPLSQTRILRKRIRASQTIFFCFLLFCFNYYPATLAYLVDSRSPQRYPYMFLWFRALSQSATSINPIIYTCLMPEFRKALVRRLCWKKAVRTSDSYGVPLAAASRRNIRLVPVHGTSSIPSI
ncbi:hypothetical protein BV898_15564 [Hypsibius exemplaris]|uniref:G-protein coupled receptors family 1 profile domain-containing protein n=1 Tax=Hypsibius exemplaris TaxID=2072580 RepID=A0A9X6NBB3_HYPEX|nr:hypothetical protein BV898_15564 [Hypsibius exemplaris]